MKVSKKIRAYGYVGLGSVLSVQVTQNELGLMYIIRQQTDGKATVPLQSVKTSWLRTLWNEGMWR